MAISTMSDDGRESRNSRQSSMMGGAAPGAGSRSVTPSLDTERLGRCVCVLLCVCVYDLHFALIVIHLMLHLHWMQRG